MKIVPLFFLCLVLGINAFKLDQSSQPADHPASTLPPMASAKLSRLQGFQNYVGDSFGQDKANTLLNLINAASTFYRDDLEKNLKYIQQNIQAAYGQGNLTFGVLIQSNSTPSITDDFVYNEWGDSYASFSTGVNAINPTWSYMVYMLRRYDNWILEYVPQIGQGIGINQATINAIKDIIHKKDGTGKCTCRQTFFIQMELNQYDSQYWNVICQSTPFTEGYVLVRDHQWITVNPYSCYYMLFAL